jgi:acyl carrier protein
VLTLTEPQLLEALDHVSGAIDSESLANPSTSPGSILLATFELDSLAVLELGIHLEERFGVFVNPQGFPTGPEVTVGDLLSYINSDGSNGPS